MLTLDCRAEDYFDRVLELIESEPSFAARVLGAANSVLGASTEEITTLRNAITRVGSSNARGIVLGMGLAHAFQPVDPWEKSIWRHAIQVAIAARELASLCEEAEVQPEEAYACGLLHDVGRLILFKVAPSDFCTTEEGHWDEPRGLITHELQACGLTHAELGATACRIWGVPRVIELVVRFHHSPGFEGMLGRSSKLIAMIHVADLAMFPSALPGRTKIGEIDDVTLIGEVADELPAFLDMDLMTLRQLLQGALSEADVLFGALGLR